jgi:tRNA threonylcarbamoyladenosine biosynthesis protein TsaE
MPCRKGRQMMIGEARTASAEETKAWGERLAWLLFPGAVIGLEGDLGAGKTCFVKGLATGLGIDADEISSPTFTLIAEHYSGKIPLYHIDLYRLEGAEIEELGIHEYLFGHGVSAIEWFHFLPAGTVDEYLHISFAFVGEQERILTLTARGERYEQVVDSLFGRRPSKGTGSGDEGRKLNIC